MLLTKPNNTGYSRRCPWETASFKLWAAPSRNMSVQAEQQFLPCSCQSTEWHALTSSSAWWGQCKGRLCYSSFFKYNSFVIIVKRFHLTTAPNSFVLVTVRLKLFWSWCLSNQNWFFLPSLAPTNHQTSLLLLNYFCRVPSGLSSSLLWLASEAIVTFPQPSPGAIF